MTLLHHDLLAAPDAEPSRWLFVLAGIYGAGRNWNGVSRAVVRARPEWGVVAVDLRGHGASPTMDPPHTLQACVEDLNALATSLPSRPEAILGHSFGGKVALLYGDEPDHGILSTWVVDSTPDAGSPRGSAWGMLEVLRGAPGPFPSRDDAIAAVQAHGYAAPVARWMGTNVVPRGDDYGWRLDPDLMEALLRDFFHTDAWSAVEGAHGPDVHLVQATESSILTAEAVARIEHAGEVTERAHLHRVEGGHWLNADNPEALVRLLVEGLPR
jgi:pimeloyl-ACP methyl ester carboxylesterase